MVFHDDGKAEDKGSGDDSCCNVSFTWNDLVIESEEDDWPYLLVLSLSISTSTFIT
jgi:hypothetical protein